MSNDLNNTNLAGRLTTDPEFQMTKSGTELLKFSIANNRKFGQQEEVNYFDVVIWGKFANTMKDFLCKGKQVIVQGKLQQQRWQAQDGKGRSKIQIVAEFIQMTDGKDGQSTAPSQTQNNNQADNNAPGNINFGNYQNTSNNDTIPF